MAGELYNNNAMFQTQPGYLSLANQADLTGLGNANINGNQGGLFGASLFGDIDWEKEGLLGGMGDIMGDIGKITNPLMQGFSLYNQWNTTNKYMDMMNEQLGMAKEQWDMTKQEIADIRNTRNNLTKQWNATAAKNAPYVKPQQAPQTLNA